MLRNHFGWARRIALGLALLGVLPALSVYAGPWLGLPPLKPVVPAQPTTPPPPYVPPASISISGYAYVDSANQHIKLPGEWGISGGTIQLMDNSGGVLATTLTNGAGFYSFSGISTGTYYSIQELLPGSNFTGSVSNLGNFLSSTGGLLATPTSPMNLPANGVSVSTTFINDIYLPLTSTSGFGPSPSGGQYSLVNVNFGSIGKVTGGSGIGKPPVQPSVPSSGTTATGSSAGLGATLVNSSTSNRFLINSSVPLTGNVKNTAIAPAASLNWSLASASTGLTLNPTSGIGIVPQGSSNLTGAFTSSTTGSKTANFTVNGSGNPSSITSNSITLNAVASRTLDSVSSATFGRVMVGQSYSTPVTLASSASHASSTDLLVKSGSISTALTNGSASFSNSTASTLNGSVTQVTGSVSVNFSATGVKSGSANFGTSPFGQGETLAAGTATLPSASVPYSATVIEARQLATVSGGTVTLATPANTGGYLYGAIVPSPVSLTLNSTNVNPDANHTTAVYVDTSGTVGSFSSSTADGSIVGKVFTSQPNVVNEIVASKPTLIDGSTATTSIPISFELLGLGPISATAGINVATAEAASVKDNTNYAPVNVQYSVSNVGLAATGGVDPANSNNQLFGAPLIAVIPAGTGVAVTSSSASLTSFVTATGSSGSLSTVANSPQLTTPGGGAFAPSPGSYSGVVGTGADILKSDTFTTGGTISMAWRGRNNDENASFTGNGSTQVAVGTKWLNSDVLNLQLQGAPANTAIALQMSFDPDINQLVNPSEGPATVASSELLQLSSGTWVAAVSLATPSANGHAFTFQASSLTDFLATYESTLNPLTGLDYTLDDLVGSWGVDLNPVPGAVPESWAILNQGSGTFAVAPEPGTIALFVTGSIMLAGWQLKKRRRLFTKAS